MSTAGAMGPGRCQRTGAGTNTADSPARSSRLGQRGAAAVEVAVLIPALLLVCLGVVGVWRVWWAHAQLDAATSAAARAAAQAAGPDQGRQRAALVLTADLAAAGLACAETDVLGGASAFGGLSLGTGQAGTVTVTSRCTVSLAALLVPGLPGTITVTAVATETIDAYREHGR